jgi:hypothetical protein
MGAVGHAVDRALATIGVDHHDFAVTGERQATVALVGDGRDVAIVDMTVAASRFDCSLTCAAPPMWNVRMVSCVPGSPIDCAAMTPTASPMFTGVPRQVAAIAGAADALLRSQTSGERMRAD